MNVVEILLITGASVDEPLKLICALTSDFAPADSPAFVSLFPQLVIIVSLIILSKIEKLKYFFNFIYNIFKYKSKKLKIKN